MSIAFDCFCFIVLFINPTGVVLSTCMGVWGSIFPSYSRVMLIGKVSLTFRNVGPILASAAEYTKVLAIWHRVWTAPLLVGGVCGLSLFFWCRYKCT